MPDLNSSPAADSGAVARPPQSQRRHELLEAAYGYVLDNGLAGMSLRPLANAIGTSPRVLLFLFASKDGLIREILARARADELHVLEQLREPTGQVSTTTVARTLWAWLAAPAHRSLLALWTEVYAQSLTAPLGPWTGFAERTVNDWLALFADLDVAGNSIERTLMLAVLRGALIDLLATGDLERTTAAVTHYLAVVTADRP